jgi:hypothetical protein
VTVRNVGAAILPAGVGVAAWVGDPSAGTAIGSATTTRALGPFQSEVLAFAVPTPPAELLAGTLGVYATVAVPAAAHECRADDNASPAIARFCGVL